MNYLKKQLEKLKEYTFVTLLRLNPVALRMIKTQCSFGHIECSGVKEKLIWQVLKLPTWFVTGTFKNKFGLTEKQNIHLIQPSPLKVLLRLKSSVLDCG